MTQEELMELLAAADAENRRLIRSMGAYKANLTRKIRSSQELRAQVTNAEFRIGELEDEISAAKRSLAAYKANATRRRARD